MSYSVKVIDHYENPRNVGSFGKEDDGVGTGMVGAPACGVVTGAGSIPGFEPERSFMGVCIVGIFAHVFLQCFGTIGKRRTVSVVPTPDARR